MAGETKKGGPSGKGRSPSKATPESKSRRTSPRKKAIEPKVRKGSKRKEPQSTGGRKRKASKKALSMEVESKLPSGEKTLTEKEEVEKREKK